jgi:iron(III) transport system ATP-binding protein
MKRQLELEQVRIGYNGVSAVKSMSFALSEGEICCLLGPSGCGKTTVLRGIAGLERIQRGRIAINGREVSSSSVHIQPEGRKVGMVFQDYALFPHLNAAENIAFGLRGKTRAEKAREVSELLDAVELKGIEKKYPHQLSGGQQQRLALARALAPKPELLLMDEPFSNLDIMLREKLSQQVREIIKKYRITAVIVTHNQFEAFAIADAIGIMNSGKLEQWDSAHNIYHRPASPFVAEFIGEGVLINGTVVSDGTVSTALGHLSGAFTTRCASGCAVELLLRPDDVLHNDDSPVKAKVVSKIFRGDSILYKLELISGERVMSLASSHHDHPIGSMIGIYGEVDDIVLFTYDASLCGEDMCVI